MKQALLLLIIFIVLSCKKQLENSNGKEVIVQLDPPPPPKVIDKNTLIGFACYYAGSKSNSVKKISDILKNKNFTNLKAKLYDVNPAEKYLATVACEKLGKKNLIKLTIKESDQIKVNKSSKEKVTICSGCTNEEELTLNDMFYSEDNFLSKSTEKWLNEMIK
ncbi:hypothetical protein [Flavobacterium sp. GSA192]|uniref:hypothetical protein n=1 Tax=Flavobacterium sp. GSA192 TaxID=2576304 RepID=UPI0011275491|nr:hypothetical protein [Flavobacterium sp. GSA192]